MNLQPYPVLICRTPALDLLSCLEKDFDQLKATISTSSPTFYELIKDLSFDQLSTLPDKVLFTLWKYHNRSCYRPTPFNHFAAISTLPLGNAANPAQISRQLVSSCFTNWNRKEETNGQVKALLKRTTQLQTNTSWYQIENQHHYLNFDGENFQLNSLDGFTELNYILKSCRQKTAKTDLYQNLIDTYQLSIQTIDSLLTQLIALQLLFSDKQANITGEEYFKRIQCKKNFNHTKGKENTNEASVTAQLSPYIIAKRASSGSFDRTKLKAIPAMVHFLSSLRPPHVAADLQAFKKQFQHKFEGRAVPLSVAMDPELGIGYGKLEQSLDMRLSFEGLPKHSPVTIPYGNFEQFLLRNIISGKHIQLKDYEKQLAKDNQKQGFNRIVLPNTFSIIFSTYQSQLVIEHAGGCTANSLLGRFTLASEEIAKITQDLVAVEQEANPDVLFFDIAYQAEKTVDNINRRKHIYPQELPILSWSTTKDPLDLQDILVSVQHNELILYSQKHQKRLIPRLASAYNYTRSDLAVYRFLCDLQHQQLCTNLTFSLKEQFPGLAYYPRTYYEDIIVAPATWLLPTTCYSSNLTFAQQRLHLQNWLTENKIDGQLKMGKSDQTLCFDTKKPQEMDYLLQHAALQKDPIYVFEALVSTCSAIKDENNKPYAAQYVLSYTHQHNLYAMAKPITNCYPKATNELHLPGENWLYFAIYSHPNQANPLLLGPISALLKAYKSIIKQWFFIRYYDPEPHLRLRLLLKDQSQANSLLKALAQLLKPQSQWCSISELQLKTYQPETIRYGKNRMPQIEQFFYQDSELVLKELRNEQNAHQIIALKDMLTFCEVAYPQLAAQLNFAKLMADAFAQEMYLQPTDFRQLNADYQQHIAAAMLAAPTVAQTSVKVKKRLHTLAQLLTSCCHPLEKEQLLADLIHMHINRLFPAEQRKHETILYHYLQRSLQIRLAKKAKLQAQKVEL